MDYNAIAAQLRLLDELLAELGLNTESFGSIPSATIRAIIEKKRKELS